MTSEAISYIPLFCTAGIALILAVLITVIKVRNTAKVSFISYLTIAVVIFACIYTVFHPGMLMYALLILLASVLMLPYCIMLAFGKPKEKETVQISEEIVELPQEVVVEDISADKVDLIEKGRSFVTLAAESFSNKDGMQTLLDCINNTCMSITNANGGAILLVDEFEDLITVKSFQGDFPPPYKLADDMPHKPLRVSTSFKYSQFPLRDNIFGEVATAGRAELIVEPKLDERIFENGPEDFLKLGSYIFIPLRLRGKDIVIGILALSKNPGSQPFTEDEFSWAQTLCGFAESALKTTLSFKQYTDQQELTKESDIASNLQKTLLPKKLPPVPGISLGTYTENVAGVCSDNYDIILARADRTSFVLMDIAGKGMNSLLVITMLRAMFRLIVNTTQSAGTILSWANRGICSELNFDHFGSVALINFDSTRNKVQLATSGSIPVLKYNSAKKAVEKVSAVCEPIGVEKTTTYKDIEFTVSKGDIIISYTDGLVEALNSSGTQYSLNNITNIVKTNANLSGKEIANLIKTDIKKFVGTETLHDDQTLLVLKIQ